MSIVSKQLAWMVLTISGLTLTGCNSQPVPEVAVQRTQVPQVHIDAKPIMSPLTSSEIAAFMTIVSHLPDGKVPEFAPQHVPPTQKPRNATEHVALLQKRFRESIDVQQQATMWQRDPKLQKAFASMGVEPVAFSALAARISFAWSALAIGEKLPVATTERQLTTNLYALMRSVQSPPENMSQHQYQQLMEALEETVALGEFLQMLKQVPRESVVQLSIYRTQMEQLLPRSTSVAAFERHLVNRPEIMRVGHSE